MKDKNNDTGIRHEADVGDTYKVGCKRLLVACVYFLNKNFWSRKHEKYMKISAKSRQIDKV
jgi:hypothetical protein